MFNLNIEVFKFLLIYFMYSLILTVVLVSLSIFLVKPVYLKDKNLSYECGFDHFNKAYVPLSVHFYIMAVLYIIFDIEIIYIFPWIKYSMGNNLSSFYNVMDFFFLLSMGYFIEYKSGVLYWEGYVMKIWSYQTYKLFLFNLDWLTFLGLNFNSCSLFKFYDVYKIKNYLHLKWK